MALFEFFLKGGLRKTCETLEYSGEIRLREEPIEDIKKIQFQYNLDRTMKVQEEYLIYDEVGMIQRSLLVPFNSFKNLMFSTFLCIY